MICPNCKSENPPDMKNCLNCGRALKRERFFRRCPQCGSINLPHKKKCRKCGSKIIF